MQEKERVANEEAEKRLKARLSAKRDPSASASRMESPSGANTPRDNSEQKPSLVEGEDNAMDVELEITTHAAEVRTPNMIKMLSAMTVTNFFCRVLGYLNWKRFSTMYERLQRAARLT